MTFTQKSNKSVDNLKKAIEVLDDNLAGALYGFAIGDAMGAATEFMYEDEIEEKYGKVTDIIGGGKMGWEPGEFTDDTQMTLCVMDALLNYPNDIEKFKQGCMNNFVDWVSSRPKDIGGQCYKAIDYYIEKGKYIKEDNNAKGNGSLMRALPCALVDNLDFNIAQSKLTHNNYDCTQAVIEYHNLIKNVLYTKTLRTKKKSLKKPTGFVWYTLNNAVYWASKGSFEEAIIGAVNHGGDSDTIAAIAGSIAGARFGYRNIPKRWIEQLNTEVIKGINFF